MSDGFFDIYGTNSQQPLFGQLHPALRAALALTALLVTLGCFSVGLLALSLLLAAGFVSLLRGPAAAVTSLRRLMPLLIIILLLNPLVSPSGTHRLFALGPFIIYGESLLWGVLTALMLAASLLWLEVFALILPADELCDLLGSAAPTLALMISLVMRLVPDLFGQAQGAKAARQACTASRSPKASQAPHPSQAEKPAPPKPGIAGWIQEKLGWAARISTALLGWTLADSLTRASSMEARGWGTGPRSRYRQWRWTTPQKLQLLGLLTLDLVLLGAFVVFQAGWMSSPAPQALLWGTLPAPFSLMAAGLLLLPLAVYGYLSWQERRLP